MSLKIPPEEKAYQLSRPDETSVHGLITLNIVGLCIVEVAVALRLWGRKLQKLSWKSDDYILMICALLVIGHCICIVLNIKHGFGHHTLVVTAAQSRVRGKVGYAFNFFYNLTFPPSRIALVLLYKRVFWVKKWFAYLCWFLISCYAGYSISTVVTCAVGTLPVEANWNKSIKPTHVIDFRKLQLANCSFNIATDIILLVMPLMVIWTLQMTKAHRAGISAVFCLGVLTVIASIMRCYYTFNASRYDPLFDQGYTGFWTVTEVYLGILCPCLVTLGPVVWASYRAFCSKLSPNTRQRVARATGVDPSDDGDDSGYSSGGHRKVSHQNSDSTGSSSNKPFPNAKDASSSTLRYKHSSDLETAALDDARNPREDAEYHSFSFAPAHHHDHLTEEKKNTSFPYRPFSHQQQPPSSLPRNNADGMAIDQDVALASLDPRSRAQDLGQSQTERLGTSALAEVDVEKKHDVPDRGIGVSHGWKLESSEKGMMGGGGAAGLNS